jgi:hypothetical protein
MTKLVKKQYVYVARLINHNNEFLEGYYKLGKTGENYNIRESQLSPTHLPFDSIMVRVFETEDMNKTEGILQTCFDDYRVIKKYDNKKEKKTEWYFVDEDEKLHSRIDKLIKLINNTKEVNIIKEIDSDKDFTYEDKKEIKESFRKSKTRLHLKYMDEDITQETSNQTYLLALTKIATQSSWDRICDLELRVTKTKEEFKEKNPSAQENQLKMVEGYCAFTGYNNEVKEKVLNRLINKLGIKDLSVTVKK